MAWFLGWAAALIVGCAAIGKFSYEWFGLAWWQAAPITVVYALAIVLAARKTSNSRP